MRCWGINLFRKKSASWRLKGRRTKSLFFRYLENIWWIRPGK